MSGTTLETTGAIFARATFGQMWGFLRYRADATSGATALELETDPDNLLIVGEVLNKGNAFVYALKTSGSAVYEVDKDAPNTTVFSVTTNSQAANNRAIIDPPTVGAGQFKGLAITSPATKYNKVICKSAVLNYAGSTFPKSNF
jgi:hypothetical protein